MNNSRMAKLCLLLGVLGFALVPTLLAQSAGQSTLVEHIVSPTATEPCAADPTVPCIDPTLADHYAWFNPITTNNQLLVYLPGNGDVPANALLFQQLAAQLGYHVIGLMYEEYFLAGLCSTAPDVNSCLFNARFEIVYGADTSTIVQVSPTNSIVNLLTKFLQYLAANYPQEGWSRFLGKGQPNWSQIALSGFSLGAGNSAMIARYSVVPRVLMLSGVVDALPMGPGSCQGGGDSWLSTHVTPSDRYWGLAHDQDSFYPHICANWDTLGMSKFGPPVQVETNTPPYGATHMLFTDLQPKRDGYKAAHFSTIIDYFTPLFPDKTPELGDAWQYMLTAPGR